jgi:hypothetical protein
MPAVCALSAHAGNRVADIDRRIEIPELKQLRPSEYLAVGNRDNICGMYHAANFALADWAARKVVSP